MKPVPAALLHRAVSLIDPDAGDREQCRRDVIEALVNIDQARRDLPRRFLDQTKKGKKAARQWAALLRKMRDVLNDLPRNLRIYDSATKPWEWDPVDPELRRIEREPNDRLLDWLLEWQKQAERIGYSNTVFKAPQVKRELKLNAALQAYILLERYGRKISAEKGSTFCRLAAMLYGERANLQRACRDILQPKNPPLSLS